MNKVPHDVWQEACAQSEKAKRVAPAYENYSVWCFTDTNVFVVADRNAGVVELAHLFLHAHIAHDFKQTAAEELIKEIERRKSREASKESWND
jgi:hypothetical protein